MNNEEVERANTSLFALEQEILTLMAFREEAIAEGKAEEIAAADKALQEYAEREVAKVDGVRAYMRHCEHMAAGAKEEAARQTERKRQWEHRFEIMEMMVQRVMDSAGKTKLEGRTGHFQIKNAGGRLPVTIDDELLIPPKFCDYVKVLRKDDIRAALEAKEDVPGATLGERGKYLQVK